MPALSFDIFCRVIDNFGDIGVCWRLARQLAGMPEGHRVRIWVDDLHTFARIQPGIDPSLPQQYAGQVEVIHWSKQAPALAPHDVVIEAFACEPPPEFLDSMIRQNSLWINLEYLSAESWVESCHALPSPQANGLRKAFFFPGFTAATGGLLRESGLLEARDAWQSRPHGRAELLTFLGVPDEIVARLNPGFLQTLLFGYDAAPAHGLVQSLNTLPKSSLVLVPAGVCPSLRRGWHERVWVHEIPFLDQDGFDRLLWSSDLNCVRGEDSLVRALWAGKPMLWQVYPQEDEAHLAKLLAFLDRSPYPDMVKQAHVSWNQADDGKASQVLARALEPEHFLEWSRSSAQWCLALAGQPDLASSLTSFCKQALTADASPRNT